MSGTATFDEAGYRAEMRADWDAAGAEIVEYVDDLESGLGLVSRRLIELAGLRPGQTVLDLGTGYGEPALGAARAVGPSGRVIGVDLSPVMIEVARRRAAGLGNVEFEAADFGAVARADGSVDAVLSRFALMLATDRTRLFEGCARMLVPGGVLAAAVWGPPTANLFVTGLVALTRELGLPSPPPDRPGAFALSSSELIVEELRAAGFAEVDVEELVVPFRFADAARYAGLTQVVMPRGLHRLAVQRLGSEDALRELFERAAAAHLDPDGSLPLPSLAYCVRAHT
ncbi:class I SAM-dependent methyltransferase [Pseudonocardia acaciae]|uniref:class I SAM-dependent methyltransferase n=1 Tax=Pseudonocardia acaciae TaxID=551276 RepID=UPI00048DB326|nr:methyltransferase domain-containing protein [Pseudonocardia acaciae]